MSHQTEATRLVERDQIEGVETKEADYSFSEDMNATLAEQRKEKPNWKFSETMVG